MTHTAPDACGAGQASAAKRHGLGAAGPDAADAPARRRAGEEECVGGGAPGGHVAPAGGGADLARRRRAHPASGAGTSSPPFASAAYDIAIWSTLTSTSPCPVAAFVA